jgi:hypothetical protein
VQQAGGGIFAHSGSIHLDRTVVNANTAAEGGGIALAGGSRLTASDARLHGNQLSAGSQDMGAGVDLLLADGEHSAAWLEPLPQPGQLSGGVMSTARVTVRGTHACSSAFCLPKAVV